MKDTDNGNRPLPKSFSPSKNDIVVGVIGKGDERFLRLIQEHVADYTRDKASKATGIDKVFDAVNKFGSFVKKNRKTGRWYAMGRTAKPLRDFITRAFRDATTLPIRNKSITQTSVSRRSMRRSNRNKNRNRPSNSKREESDTDDDMEVNEGGNDDDMEVNEEKKEVDPTVEISVDGNVDGSANGTRTDRDDADEPVLPKAEEEPAEEEPVALSPPPMKRTTTEVFDSIEPVLGDPNADMTEDEELNPTETHDSFDETEPVQAEGDALAPIESIGAETEPVQATENSASPTKRDSKAGAEVEGSTPSSGAAKSPFQSPSQLFAPLSPGMLKVFSLVEGSPMQVLSETKSISVDLHDLDQQFAETMSVPSAINVNHDPSFSQESLSQESDDHHHMSSDEISMALSPFFLSGTPQRSAISEDEDLGNLLGFLSP